MTIIKFPDMMEPLLTHQEKPSSSLYLLYKQAKAARERVSVNFQVERFISSEIHEHDLEETIKFSVSKLGGQHINKVTAKTPRSPALNPLKGVSVLYLDNTAFQRESL